MPGIPNRPGRPPHHQSDAPGRNLRGVTQGM